MNTRFIATYTRNGIYGEYAVADTPGECLDKLVKLGVTRRRVEKSARVYRFESELPFVELGSDREADEHEADCWIGRDGSINWIRCERSYVASPITS